MCVCVCVCVCVWGGGWVGVGRGREVEGGEKQVIVRKYGEEEGSDGYGVGLWKAVGSGWNEFNKRVEFRVGDGRWDFGRTGGVVRIPCVRLS